MIVTGHQADLFPPSGFWYKMAKADLFDLRIYDQFQPLGHQQRVMMRDTWAVMPVVECGSRAAINQVRIDPVETPRMLGKLVTGRYRGARNWGTLGPVILDMITDIHTDHLWQFNLSLILGVRDLLDIRTPIAIARSDRATHEELDASGTEVEGSRHRAFTDDSILTLLMDLDDPMERVMVEHQVREEISA